MTLFATVLFIVIFGLIVFVHEFGHYWVARREGMTVKEFALGFPPRIFSWVRGGTRYAINLLPLGGYVNILGEGEEVDDKGSFSKAKPWARFRVIIAGIVINVLFAWLLLTIWFWIAPMQGTSGALVVSQVMPDSAAEQADIRANDFILGADGTTFDSAAALTEFTRANQGQEVVFEIRRNGSTIEETVVLGQAEAPLGVSVVDMDASMPDIAWYAAPYYALLEIGAIIVTTFSFLGAMILGLFGMGREAVSVNDLSGPVGIYSHLQQVSTLGLASILRFSAFISLAIAIFNALPIPALDGGRGIFILWEAITGKKIVSQQKEGIIHAIGFLLLIALMIFVTILDVQKL